MTNTDALIYNFKIHTILGRDPKVCFTLEAAQDIVSEIKERDDKIAQLEKEADWLAGKLARFDTCPNEMLEADVDCFLRCERHMYTKPCWRAFATKAVEDASNNA